MSITAKVEIVTPESAATALADQAFIGETRQRRLNRTDVVRYARAMAEGKWLLNGEPIIFNGRTVIDGQHRLEAVRQAGVPVKMLVVRGVSSDAFMTIDQGRVRNAATLLEIAGLPNRNQIAGGARLVMLYEKYGSMDYRSDYPSRTEVAEYVLSNRQMWEDNARHSRLGNIQISTSLVTAFSVLLSPNYKTEWEAFKTDLDEGVSLRPDQPVRLLREVLIKLQSPRRVVRVWYIAALLAKAWNAELDGRSMKLLKYLDSESFPQIKR